MNQDINSNIQALLEKYAGGRMPLLADLSDSGLGLISPHVLRVYHSGFTRQYSTPMGMLLSNPNLSTRQKWDKGGYEINEWNEPEWTELCKRLRKEPEGNAICVACDRRQALLAESQREVITYMCDNGLIDFAVPILVKKQVVAVLFCGQFKPAPHSIWNPEMIQPNGYFRPLQPGEKGIEIQSESQRRLDAVGGKLGLQDISEYSTHDITPEKVVELQEEIRKSSRDLSDLATSTYELEKGKIVDWMQNRITRALSLLSDKTSDTPEAATDFLEIWRQLSLELPFVLKYFGVDYMLILSLHDDFEKSLRLLCQAGLPVERFPIGVKWSLNVKEYSAIAEIFNKLKGRTGLRLTDHEDLPFFERLCRLHRKSKHVLAIPAQSPNRSTSLAVIMGRAKRETSPDDFSRDDMASLQQIVSDTIMVAELILLVEQLGETTTRQARFLEDVAHDTRTPIQNLIVQAQALNLDMGPEMIKQIGQEMAKQARRLNRMSTKIWTMVNIDRGDIHLEAIETIPVYQTLTETRKFLLDLADKRGIRIIIDKALEDWSPVYVHKTLFSQAILNLLDNAIKYSRDNTEIRIDGRWLPDGVSLSFVNRGIPIPEEDRDKIFERYHRTKEAQMFGVGTGIGLYIVKCFIEHAGGKITVRSDPVPGSKKDYITVFELFIPHYQRR